MFWSATLSSPLKVKFTPVLPVCAAAGAGRVCRDHQRGRRVAGGAARDRLRPPGGRHPLPHRQQRADVQRDRGGQSETGGLGGAALQH